MFEYYFYGLVVRLGETVIYSSLWLVAGLMIAAIFRHMMGPEKVRDLFGEGTRRGIFTGWLIGMLLPVCSLGVIPIVRELHRCGVKGGTIIAFGLTAPLFNPMSVLYGLTLSDPIAILSFSLCALIIVSLLGLFWDWMFSDSNNVTPDDKMPAPGVKRLAAVFHSMAREIVGPTAVYVSIGILCSVFVAVAFQHGNLQHTVERDNWMAPISVAAVALPIYSTPLLAMSQIGGMFQHGNSIGAAFSLLILGAGANIGLFAWFMSIYGWHRTVAFLAVLAATTIALAYAVDKPLYPKGVEPAGHTHAFDVYTHPFHFEESNLAGMTKKRLSEFWQSNEFGSTKVLGGLIVIGILCFFIGNQRIESWLYSLPPEKKASLDIVLPGWLLGGVSVIGLVAASVVGSYMYYPAPGPQLEQLSVINTECVLSARNEKWEAADKWIPYADDLSRRLEVGVFLRNGSVDSFKSAKAKIYREKLDVLKESVDNRDPTGIIDLANDVSVAYSRMSKAFRGEDE